MRKPFALPKDGLPHGFADSTPFLHAGQDGFVNHAASFFGHSKPAGIDFGFDFLRRVPHQRQFEIMNDDGPIDRDRA